ncbi:PI-PLC domain-containing protein [Pedobacter sandarakinus]|uniref:hypothetical protein n=1 Tax=Pedobacter sandarakinus TaxID=353156 RepID=UPI0022477DBA|nr:hypothetical protein [Pedobacter sandarakinus]MCX2575267.1 hypothetical protein [Pedobacter sandarakinus]
MMKKYLALFVLVCFGFAVHAQIKIHSHNDYSHKEPFYDAIAHHAFSIEADVFLQGDSLMVAHSRNEIKAGRTLERLYLKPLSTFSKTKSYYKFSLLIDIKDGWDESKEVLLNTLLKYKKYVGSNGQTVDIVITGHRPDSNFYWDNLYFDGLPHVNYNAKDLKKISMISDNFAKYSKWKGEGEISDADKTKLKTLVDDAHALGKPFRFWGAPDNAACWLLLKQLGVDIINTDLVGAATEYFKNHQP